MDIYPKNLMKNLKDNNNQLHLLQQNKANKNRMLIKIQENIK